METKKAMNPYLAGALSGLLLIASVIVSGNYFGTSTAIVQITGMLEKAISPELVAGNKYFAVVEPVLSWQIFFVAGIFLGSFIAAKLFGDFKWQSIPNIWKNTLGSNKIKRMILAFTGGVIAIFGVRMAGGCPSGQMSAMILLSVSGLLAMSMFFIIGIATARLVYRGGNK